MSDLSAMHEWECRLVRSRAGANVMKWRCCRCGDVSYAPVRPADDRPVETWDMGSLTCSEFLAYEVMTS